MLKPPQSPRFKCPNCEAIYKVIRVEAVPANDPGITCCVCGAPLHGREVGFVLKYFLVERRGDAKYRRARAASKPVARPNTRQKKAG